MSLLRLDPVPPSPVVDLTAWRMQRTTALMAAHLDTLIADFRSKGDLTGALAFMRVRERLLATQRVPRRRRVPRCNKGTPRSEVVPFPGLTRAGATQG